MLWQIRGRPNTASAISCAVGLGLLLSACQDPPASEAPPARREADAAVRPAPATEASVVLEAAPGNLERRTFGGRDVLGFELAVAGPEAQLVEIVVHQEGSDVEVVVTDAAGRPLPSVDRADGGSGLEELALLAPAPEHYGLVVRRVGGEASGSVAVEIRNLRPPVETDFEKAAADRFFAQAEELRSRRDRDSCLQAAERYREALAGFETVGDRAGQAEVLQRLGWLHRKYLEQQELALGYYQRAGRLFAELGDTGRESSVVNNVGRVHFWLGDMEQAAGSWSRALELKRQLGDRSGEAASLANLGLASRYLGRLQEALVYYDRALDVLIPAGPTIELGRAFNNRGRFYDSLGQPEQALADLRRALRIGEQLGEASLQAMALTAIGGVQLEGGDAESALASLERAAELRLEAGSELGRAVTLRGLGEVLETLGRLPAAAAAQRQALALFEAQQSARDVARAHLSLGNLSLAAGRAADAQARFARAGELFGRLEDLEGEVASVAGRARALRLAGELDAAVTTMETALAGIDRLRLRAATPDLRAAFLARHQGDVGFLVDVLMEMNRHQPGRGHDRRAFEAHERWLARALVGRIAMPVQGGEVPGLRGREQETARQLELLVRQRRALRDRDTSPPQLRALESKLDEAVRRLRSIRGEMALRGGRIAAVDGEVLDAAGIRRQLLDPHSVMLVYRLGEERSYLWLLATDVFSSAELGPGAEIAALVDRAYRLLRRLPRRETRAFTARTLEQLSARLLGPVAGSLGDRRLLIVADGALHTLPFAALPLPDGSGRGGDAPPLVARHQVVLVPSASSVAALRRRAAGRVWRHTVAVIAPQPGAGGAPEVARRAAEHEPALPGAVREAESIERLAEAVPGASAVRFAATARTLRAAELASFRIVHLAAHAHIDASRPELSRLVFGVPGDDGQDAVLYAGELGGLDLPAELVVLSACETALGREIRGEGLVGLPQGFFEAGASSVLVSLWKVDDRATAELMGHFYTGLLRQGLPAPAALRRAQLEMAGRGGGRRPYFWAGFTLLGEWLAAPVPSPSHRSELPTKGSRRNNFRISAAHASSLASLRSLERPGVFRARTSRERRLGDLGCWTYFYSNPKPLAECQSP